MSARAASGSPPCSAIAAPFEKPARTTRRRAPSARRSPRRWRVARVQRRAVLRAAGPCRSSRSTFSKSWTRARFRSHLEFRQPRAVCVRRPEHGAARQISRSLALEAPSYSLGREQLRHVAPGISHEVGAHRRRTREAVRPDPGERYSRRRPAVVGAGVGRPRRRRARRRPRRPSASWAAWVRLARTSGDGTAAADELGHDVPPRAGGRRHHARAGAEDPR